MAFRLPLAPPETLGRRFQYALLSLDPKLSSVDPRSGSAVFESNADYVSLVSLALDAIDKLRVAPTRRARHSGSCSSTLSCRGFQVDCCSLHRGPSLYAVGRRGRIGGRTYVGDYLTLAAAGFTGCPYVTGRGGSTIAWTHAAVSYACEVLSRGGPLGGSAEDLPWLAKATVFGKVRATGGGRAPGGSQQPTLDTLGSVLLGGAVSFLWSQRLGESQVEFYLVPDAVHGGFAALRGLMLAGGAAGGVAARAAWLASEYPVSLEVALALALAAELAGKYGPASALSSYTEVEELERAAVVLTVTPQQRPMVRSSIPLSTIIYRAYKPSTIYSILDAARQAGGPGGSREVQGLRDVLGGCMNSMYLQALHPRWSDHLSGCIRGLLAASQQASNKGLRNLAGNLEHLASTLARDYQALARH